MRILMAEDDAPLADFLLQGLKQEQFSVQLATGTIELQRLAGEGIPDMVLLDLNAATGLDALRAIHAQKPDLPVMLLTNGGSAEERVRGLNAGADDCVTKPFVFAELVACIRAVLRRGRRTMESLKLEDLELDGLWHMVGRSGRSIDLMPKDCALCEFTMR